MKDGKELKIAYDIECLEHDLNEEKSNLKELQEELEELNN